ncbi:MAG TPA: hypothetical protein VI027_02895 [Rubrobacteraceae bacterium]
MTWTRDGGLTAGGVAFVDGDDVLLAGIAGGELEPVAPRDVLDLGLPLVLGQVRRVLKQAQRTHHPAFTLRINL